MSFEAGQKGCSGGAPVRRCKRCRETFVVGEGNGPKFCPECENELSGSVEPQDVLDQLRGRGW